MTQWVDMEAQSYEDSVQVVLQGISVR